MACFQLHFLPEQIDFVEINGAFSRELFSEIGPIFY